MAVLADTSAWIEFFHPRGMPGAKHALTFALEDGAVVTAAPVLTELLAGFELGHAAGARALARLRALEMLVFSWDTCMRAGDLGRRLVRRGRRVPTVDLMIAAAAMVGGHDVWHVGDRHFLEIERAGGPRQRDLTEGDP